MILFGSKWKFLITIMLLISYSRAQRVLCYYANWSEERNSSFRLLPWNIEVNICTHVVYAFAMPNLSEGVVPLDFLNTLNDNASNEFSALKSKRPDLTLMLSIGGWQEGSKDFSQIAADPSAVQWIAEVLCQKVRNVGFDGLDINWQWPVPGLREGSNAADKENFVNLIHVMREHFDREGRRTNRRPLQLSVVLPPFKTFVDLGFDLNKILRDVDFVNIHSMDYHISTASKVNHLAPLYEPQWSLNNTQDTVDSTVRMYLDFGITPRIMNLGIPFYGYSFELDDPSNTDLLASASEEGPPGFGINTPGMLAYFEICRYIIDENWTVRQPNMTAVGPYAFHDSKWVGYDDTEIIRKKVQYAMNKGLGGIMLMTIDMDDFNGICRDRYPLTNAVMEALRTARQTSGVVEQNTSPTALPGNIVGSQSTNNAPSNIVPTNIAPSNIVPSANVPSAPINQSPTNSNQNQGPPLQAPEPNRFLTPSADTSSTSTPIRKDDDSVVPLFIGYPTNIKKESSVPYQNVPSIPPNNIDVNYPFSEIKTPGKFTLKTTRMQFNKNFYYY